MKVLNFGSLNIDYVYTVDHIVQGGETISSTKTETFPGGKGAEPVHRPGKGRVPVYHAGAVGEDGEMLLDLCGENGVNTEFIRRTEGRNGHTVIQVDRNGQNCIILFGGSNQKQTREHIDEVLGNFAAGDMLVLQNEVNELDYIIDKAYERGMVIVLNPSPFDSKLEACDMKKVTYFLVNEVEAEQMTGESSPEKQPEKLLEMYPQGKFVLTMGSRGSLYKDSTQEYHQGIYKVKAVDTTAAGDTFTGFFLASVLEGKEIPEALDMAARASAIAVSRAGASSSIPTVEEVKHFQAE